MTKILSGLMLAIFIPPAAIRARLARLEAATPPRNRPQETFYLLPAGPGWSAPARGLNRRLRGWK